MMGTNENNVNNSGVCLEVWIDVDRWKPSLNSAALLMHLKPNGSGECQSEYEKLELSTREYLGSLQGNELFSLRNCVMGLPPPQEEDVSVKAELRVAAMNEEDVFPIHLLPDEVMFRMLGFLDHMSLQALARTCRYFRIVCNEITPGMLLKLYPHQRAAIHWMLERERGERCVEHPCWRYFESKDGSFWGNTSTGEISEDPPETYRDFSGGFLCDDPGLGKTITCIGLMTRTKGHLPIPDGHKVMWFGEQGCGKNYGYISLCPMSSSNESDRQRSKRRKIALAGKYSPVKHAARSRTVSGKDTCMKQLDFSGSGEQVVASEEKKESWIQCDLCSAWRRLPAGYEFQGSEWCCYLHPLPRMQSCLIDGDVLDEDDEVVSMMGWVGPSDVVGQKAHVDFYTNTLQSHGELFSTYGRYKQKSRTILHWLVRRSPESFNSVFTLPSWAAQPPGYGSFLKKIGFIPYNGEVVGDYENNILKSTNKRPPGYQKSSRTQDDWLVWTKPASYLNMMPDIESLNQALSLDLSDTKIRVYLSPATLIVVPSELVQHWKHQIFQHTAHGCLRVMVYDSTNSHHRRVTSEPQALAWEYDVVITTFTMLSSDWNPKDPLHCSPLCRIFWQRIIIDEGHTLGTLSMTNRLQMLTSLMAGSRWCLTGTPVQSSTNNTLSAMKCIQPIMSFFQDVLFGNAVRFQEIFEKPIKIAPEISMRRMFGTLSRIMARSSKSSLRNLPRLCKSVHRLDFCNSHAVSYGSLIDLVRFNLLTSDWFDPDHYESLMSPRQGSRASSFLFNVALACNVAGTCVLQVSQDDLFETLDLLTKQLGVEFPCSKLDGPPFLPESHEMKRVEDSLCHGGLCDRCQKQYRILFVTPCACLTCVDCTATNRLACSHCRTPYTMHACSDPSRLKDNPNPKWDVPWDLIEWQPAYAQHGALGHSEGAWQPTWSDTDSSKCIYLIDKLRTLGLVPSDTPLVGEHAAGNKAIIFTQFWHHALLIERSLQQHISPNGFCMYRRQMSQLDKAAEIRRFRTDSNCKVMLMDESGALGLDLSFVNHIFLMEPIANASLEDQIISRAHRMGAVKDVYVETIVMKGSIEEDIISRDQGHVPVEDACTSQGQPPNEWRETVVSMEFASKEKDHQEIIKRNERNKLLMSLRRPKICQ